MNLPSNVSDKEKNAVPPFLVVGPVIGTVTDTTARILIETNVPCNVICKLKSEDEGTAVTQSIATKFRRPCCFAFEGLQPQTYYKIRLNVPAPGLTKAGFMTLPINWNISSYAARFAFVSGTSFTFLRDETDDAFNLWKRIYKSATKHEIDYLVHIGDNVYVDNDEYRQFKGKRDFIGALNDNIWQTALNCLQNVPSSRFHEYYEDVCELFRIPYRETWNFPIVKQTLANIPNIMFINEYEIRVGFGDQYSDCNPDSVEYFLACCAYEVYNEYQYNLSADYISQETFTRNFPQVYRFHTIGEIAILAVDTRYENIMRSKNGRNGNTECNKFPLLGQKQMKHIRSALSSTGVFSKCKILFAVVQKPICVVGTNTVYKLNDDFYIPSTGLWWNHQNLPETMRFLTLLFEWRANNSTREVCILGSGVGTGYETDIYDQQYTHMPDDRLNRIKHFTLAPIAAPIVTTYLKKLLAKSGYRKHELSSYQTFRHNDFFPHLRQYGVVDVYTECQRVSQANDRLVITKFTMQLTGVTHDGNITNLKLVDSTHRPATSLAMSFFGCCGLDGFDALPTIPGLNQSKKKKKKPSGSNDRGINEVSYSLEDESPIVQSTSAFTPENRSLARAERTEFDNNPVLSQRPSSFVIITSNDPAARAAPSFS